MIGNSANRSATRQERWLTIRPCLAVLLFFCGTMPLFAADPVDPAIVTDRVFRLAFSEKMFSQVQVEDARAAMKVWMMTVFRERSIPTDPDPKIYDNLEEMLRGSQGKPAEGFGITSEECWQLSKEIKIDRLVVGAINGRIAEEYVVLVHRDSPIGSLADLRERSLIVLENPRMSLATIWLDTFLLQNGMAATAKFFKSTTLANKLSQVVLPVFFRNSDACLVTRRGFQTMSELNPQVGKQLRILATSQELVPVLFAFRADHASPFREQMLVEMRRLPETPAGQQILTLLQTERVEEQPMSCLTAAFELLATHQRLCSAVNSAKAKTETPGSGQKKSSMRGQ
ncbi:MAG: PhnD/SsuA/transferrin family substrate-binding protein [Pseudomonadota bacterium]